jgi:chromate transporter
MQNGWTIRRWSSLLFYPASEFDIVWGTESAAVLPFWSALRRNFYIRAALKGINASVVGVLIAALFQPLWTTTVHTAADFWIVLLIFALLTVWKVQPWKVVAGVVAASVLASTLWRHGQ